MRVVTMQASFNFKIFYKVLTYVNI